MGGTEDVLPRPGKPAQQAGASMRGKGRALLDKGNAAVDRAKASRAGTFWTRLNAVDFMNSAFRFATFSWARRR
jgi:hypothetical protein